jgi:hypothetical protein
VDAERAVALKLAEGGIGSLAAGAGIGDDADGMASFGLRARQVADMAE